MKNQHEKISGYRDLTQGEVDNINGVKLLGEDLGLEIESILNMREFQLEQLHKGEKCSLTEHQLLESIRLLNVAKQNLQTGIMYLVRSIALPNTF